MLDGIREIGIFLVIAQAILYFVPGESYSKYVKVIVGVLLIALAVRPVLGLFKGQGSDLLSSGSEAMWDILQQKPEEAALENSSSGIYEGIEKELTKSLLEKVREQQPSGYQVTHVSLSGEGEEGMVSITLKKEEDLQEAGEERGQEGAIKIEKTEIPNITLQEEASFPEEEEQEKEQALSEHFAGVLNTEPDRIRIFLSE